MIQTHRAGHYLDFSAMQKTAQREAYKGYLAERRNLPTETLQQEVQRYDRKSKIGKFLFRAFSDEDALLRINAARQVLEERAVAA